MDSDVVERRESSSGNPEETSLKNKSTRHDRITRLPLTRIKNIIKTDPDVTLASQESVLLIAKATEMFLQHFAKTSYNQTARGKRKTIKRQDVDLSIEALDAYAFLEGMMD
ncbi:DNA polymerase epsilon subunit 4-like [Asterias rubens]|uniref:DNA polymerase epsilon subunit 4-like n=1 Tax=Asterias rubens TaxID=7604 RepID=UPI00145514DF|nr:DNA polymerase epsilon subunit 4-like [Asterias rubens]